MNKHTVITVVAIIAIVIPFAFSGMNIYAAEQIQYRWNDPGKFSFFELMNNGRIELCNTQSYPTNFEIFEITIYYQGENKGTYKIENLEINSSEIKLEKGTFVSDNFIDTQRLFLVMDFQFDGGDNRVDARHLFVNVSINTKIIGIIPYSIESQYSGFDFDQLMNGENFQC